MKEATLDTNEHQVPPGLCRTRRAGLPQLWGVWEMTEYANQVADELGKARPGPGRAWTWDRVAGFPTPVAELEMGNVWLAEELMPWIRARLSTERFLTTPIDEETRAAIRREEGRMSLRAAAAKHGVGATTVRRIWRGER